MRLLFWIRDSKHLIAEILHTHRFSFAIQVDLSGLTDNIHITEDFVTRKLQILRLHSYISAMQCRVLKSARTGTPNIPDSPKDHRDSIPLFWVLCIQNWRYHKLILWLVHILISLHVTLTPEYLENSFETTKLLENFQLISLKMYPIGLSSLFSNVLRVT